MPLVALLDGERVEAFRLTTRDWARVRAGSRTNELKMTCGAGATPKTSPLGLRFFAHKPGAICAVHIGAAESQEHLQTKAILAEAARSAGWEAEIEHVGPGGAWIADVLVRKGKIVMALEAQWSAQRVEEFQARSARYEAAGIHCRWFLGPRNHTRDIPHAYRLQGSVDSITCSVPGEPFEENQYRPLQDAAVLLLSGGVRPSLEVRVRSVVVEFMKLRCWADQCGRWYSRWWVAGADVTSRCGVEAYLDGALEFYRWRPFANKRVEERLQPHIPRLTTNEQWPEPCRYETRDSERAGRPYVMAICPHCRRGQGDAFLVTSRRPRVEEITLRLDPAARADFSLTVEAQDCAHICTDVGDGHCDVLERPEDEVTFPVPR